MTVYFFFSGLKKSRYPVERLPRPIEKPSNKKEKERNNGGKKKCILQLQNFTL